MTGSRTGAITQWNDATGQGLITEDGDGVHVVDAADCSAGLLAALRGRAIPPGKPVRVTFDVDVTNHAINVDLAKPIAPEPATASDNDAAVDEVPQGLTKRAAVKKSAQGRKPRKSD